MQFQIVCCLCPFKTADQVYIVHLCVSVFFSVLEYLTPFYLYHIVPWPRFPLTDSTHLPTQIYQLLKRLQYTQTMRVIRNANDFKFHSHDCSVRTRWPINNAAVVKEKPRVPPAD